MMENGTSSPEIAPISRIFNKEKKEIPNEDALIL
jgi:hypothetical protein